MTFGLVSIQERLMYIGGHMEVESAPGKGARITLWCLRTMSKQICE